MPKNLFGSYVPSDFLLSSDAQSIKIKNALKTKVPCNVMFIVEAHIKQMTCTYMDLATRIFKVPVSFI
jgi:hypothetical protein